MRFPQTVQVTGNVLTAGGYMWAVESTTDASCSGNYDAACRGRGFGSSGGRRGGGLGGGGGLGLGGRGGRDASSILSTGDGVFAPQNRIRILGALLVETLVGSQVRGYAGRCRFLPALQTLNLSPCLGIV